MSTSTESIPELLSLDQVALHLKITVPRLRKLKGELLTEGEHWIRDPQDDRRTLYNRRAIEILVANLGGPVEPPAASEAPATLPTGENAGPAAPAASAGGVLEETLEVVSSPRVFPGGEVKHFHNPRVISARRTSGEVVYVRVPESRHFIPRLQDGSPMTLRARFEGNPANWSLIGRCPRWTGRW